MFNPHVYENSRPDGFGVLEVPPRADEPRRFVPLRRTELRGEVVGPLAALRLVQTFRYSRAECDKTLEAVYRFPLPGDAAVTSVLVRFGQVTIRAELKERQQAEADYEEARRQGQQAAQLTRESPDVFTLRVAGLQPEEDVTVETGYVQLARAEGAGWSLRVPLTTAPRYVRSDETTSRHAEGQPLFLLRDPGHRFALDLALPGAGAVESSTHALDVLREGESLHVRLRAGEVVPDRDCVLSWRPAQAADRPALQVFLHDDRTADTVYFLALAAPPATHDVGQGVAREVTLLVDHSGSMQGAKWEAADWTVERFLADLRERDYFSLGLFHNTTRWLATKPQKAGTRAVEKAVEFLKKHRDSGGTELGVALEQALDRDRPKGDFTRHVLVVTDAEVSDAGRVLQLAEGERERPDRRRISVICIDAAPNAQLATELAERGGGVSRFLTSRPEEEDIATALDAVLADWAEPVLAGLRLEVNRPHCDSARQATTAAGEAGWSAVDLGDLTAGRAVWVAGRVPRGPGPLAFRLAAGKSWDLARWQTDLAAEGGSRPALKALFGARRVTGLEYLMHGAWSDEELAEHLRRLGYDPEQVRSGSAGKGTRVYAENRRQDVRDLLKDLLVGEALAYGLASAETAFVAVRSEAGKVVEETVAVANALPAEWSGAFATATLSAPAAYTGSPTRMQVLSLGASAAAPPPRAAARRGLGGLLSRMMGGSSPPASPEEECELAEAGPGPAVIFAGKPAFTGPDLVLFDTSRPEDAAKLPADGRLDLLAVRFPQGTPEAARLDPGLCVLLFVGDLAAPRARVRLVDLVRQRGERPLNVLRRGGEVVRVVLADPAGAWRQDAPAIEVTLRAGR